MPVWLYAHRSQKLKSLQEQLAAYVAETDKERQKLEQDKADLKKKEDSMRARLQAEFDKKKKELQKMFDKKQEELQRKFGILEAERRNWEEEKERVKQTTMFDKVVTLDVGGTKYWATLSTLTKYPDSMLGVMFSGRHDLPQQEDGSYFIDRDGEVFKYILMYLRDPTVAFIHAFRLDEAQQLHLKLEANYFLLPNLEKVLQQALDQRAAIKENELKRTIAEKEKREGTTNLCLPLQQQYSTYTYDMSRMTQGPSMCTQEMVYELQRGALRANKVDFREYIAFHNCDLSGAEFHSCSFKKGASFEGSILDNAVFENVSDLVTHRVHFTPRQVAKARFQPELLDALRANGCIY